MDGLKKRYAILFKNKLHYHVNSKLAYMIAIHVICNILVLFRKISISPERFLIS